MAFDGIVISNIVKEMNDRLINGRIYKVAQPENDELIITIKNNKEQYKLLLSASASLPLLYFTNETKPNPMTAPNFCMLLRKHLNNGRIIRIYQPDFERIVHIDVEHLNEMGDLCTHTLIIELMGKHSNIIFVNNDNMIIDSIKHVSSQMSSIREVLPGREYFVPNTTTKLNPMTVTYEDFSSLIFSKAMPIRKAIYTSLTGISPLIAEEVCFNASIDSDTLANVLNDIEKQHLFNMFSLLFDDIRACNYTPNVIMKGNEPVEFASLPLNLYDSSYTVKNFTTISELLEFYYASKNTITRIRQKSVDLRKIVQNALERNVKKYDLQLRQLKDTEKREKYKVYGELINTYGYSVSDGSKSMTALNYYTNEEITIPLDDTISVMDNAKKYFDKYGKLKRTFEALTELIKETESEIKHLESISNSLDIALSENDLIQIKEELTDYGYIKRKYSNKKVKITSKPFHYISSDGFHMYVGKNNYQNEELTFKFANGGDWWFHAKDIPGSHVIVKTEGNELPDRTFEEAGKLAAYYSKGRDQEKVEIDYTERKYIKKPAQAAPGFVIYHTNYSLMIEPDISGIEEIK